MAYWPITLSGVLLKVLERVVQWFILDPVITRPLVYVHTYTRGFVCIDLLEGSRLTGNHAIAVSSDCSEAFNIFSLSAAKNAIDLKMVPSNMHSHGCSAKGGQQHRTREGALKVESSFPLVWNLVMETLLSQLA